nr:tetratricopeptide repeat protein [Blastocatellia bacterium]
NNEYEYLSDGLTETLINNLSQLPDLSVKARSSVFSYKGKNVSPQQIGTELAVGAVLNGRLLQRGDNITLSVELVDARNGNQIWGEQYSHKLVDLTALQSSIARDVSNKLQKKLTATEGRQIAKKYTTDSEAYQLYLKGLFHWNKRTVDDLKTAIRYFDQAREKDPSFALAYVGLALTYSVLPSNTLLTKEETNEANLKAKAAALRALELDNSLAEPHTVLALVNTGEWDFAAAENEFKRAIELNPNYATAHQWYSELLARLGRNDEALVEIKRAYELDPFSTAVNMNVGLRYADAGRADEAFTQFKKTIELSPDYPMAYWYLADIYVERGMYEESFAMASKGNLLLKVETPESEERKTSELRQAVKAQGVEGYWRKMLEYEMAWYEKGIGTPFYVAAIYAELGEKDKAFEWLEKAYVDRAFDLTNLKTNRRFRSLRSDPRFQDLVRRIGLSQ